MEFILKKNENLTIEGAFAATWVKVFYLKLSNFNLQNYTPQTQNHPISTFNF